MNFAYPKILDVVVHPEPVRPVRPIIIQNERKYLFNGKGIEEDEQYIGRTEKEMDTDIDWSTDSNTNPLLDSIYTLASAAEIIRKPTNKIPRQAKNKKKGLGQREDDHSGDYQNNNELYYGQSM